jgi:hypothetical protein
VLEALGNLGDFIGGIAVIATLAYLAVQVRQNTRLLRATALSASSAANVSFNHLLGGDPAVARVFQVGLEDFGVLSEEEQRQFLQLLRGLVTSYEHRFQQHALGMIEEEIWQRQRTSLKSMLSSPHLAVWWEHRKSAFDPTFVENLDRASSAPSSTLARELITEMLAETPSERKP